MLPLALWVRRLLFISSGCSNCYELGNSLRDRLCVSVSSAVDFDLVVVPQDFSGAGEKTALQVLERRIRQCDIEAKNVYLIGGPALADAARDSAVQLLDSEEMSGYGDLAIPEALLHSVPSISDYFIVIPESFLAKSPITFLDYFTANGLPLLYRHECDTVSSSRLSFSPSLLWKKLGKGDSAYLPYDGPYGQTRENSEAILEFLLANKDMTLYTPQEYRYAAMCWSYAEKRGAG